MQTMNCVFVQLRCKPGTTYAVADEIYERDIVSELYSTSGEFDLLLKIYIPHDEDIGKFLNERILDIPNIKRSLTTLTFKAF
ncbi:MAG TPA: Lrp/AsnC ligand binding domain-containing protein [Thiolinea sp.]|nr:Lrp/AsnC ligand binding domain-containing protein [Thiolinea sp.]